jgi:hypothetical protein
MAYHLKQSESERKRLEILKKRAKMIRSKIKER